MTHARRAWHHYLSMLLRQRGPREFEVRLEVPIGKELPRVDYLLLRRRVARRQGLRIGRGASLVGLWPLLPQETVVEFKSIGRPYRRKDLNKLLGYAFLHSAVTDRLVVPQDLACALIVPLRNQPLLKDIELLGLKLSTDNSGYGRILGGSFAMHLVEIDLVAETDNDDVLRFFSHEPQRTLSGRRWVARWVGGNRMKVHELEEHDEVIEKFLNSLPVAQRLANLTGLDLGDELIEGFLRSLPAEQRLAGLPAEQRLAGLPAEQRLAGLPAEQRLAGLPAEQRVAGLPAEQRVAGLGPEELLLSLPREVLRGLSDSYLASLPAALRGAILARIQPAR